MTGFSNLSRQASSVISNSLMGMHGMQDLVVPRLRTPLLDQSSGKPSSGGLVRRRSDLAAPDTSMWNYFCYGPDKDKCVTFPPAGSSSFGLNFIQGYISPCLTDTNIWNSVRYQSFEPDNPLGRAWNLPLAPALHLSEASYLVPADRNFPSHMREGEHISTWYPNHARISCDSDSVVVDPLKARMTYLTTGLLWNVTNLADYFLVNIDQAFSTSLNRKYAFGRVRGKSGYLFFSDFYECLEYFRSNCGDDFRIAEFSPIRMDPRLSYQDEKITFYIFGGIGLNGQIIHATLQENAVRWYQQISLSEGDRASLRSDGKLLSVNEFFNVFNSSAEPAAKVIAQYISAITAFDLDSQEITTMVLSGFHTAQRYAAFDQVSRPEIELMLKRYASFLVSFVNNLVFSFSYGAAGQELIRDPYPGSWEEGNNFFV